MIIPFAPPLISDAVRTQIEEVMSSGWITTGPKVKALEEAFTVVTGAQSCIAVNSWSSGAILALKWLGLEAGDEVVIPAYTYAATALSVLHAGGTPVMCDVNDDYCIDHRALSKCISSKTKAVIPVDYAGLPVDYEAIRGVINEKVSLFIPRNSVQQKMGRMALIADAAHSFGAKYSGESTSLYSDITIYSTHAVKNITTAEGGVIVLNLPKAFDIDEEYRWFVLNRLNGQTKDAFSKSKAGSWRYDIVSVGYKMNMPDICAAIGVGQMSEYESIHNRRCEIFDMYSRLLNNTAYVLPERVLMKRESSCHLYAIRLSRKQEHYRDDLIQSAADHGIALNVHFISLPMLTVFSRMGYRSEDTPNSTRLSLSEISLPIYPQLTDEMVEYVVSFLNKHA